MKKIHLYPYRRTVEKCFFKLDNVRIVVKRTGVGCYDIKPDKPIEINYSKISFNISFL